MNDVPILPSKPWAMCHYPHATCCAILTMQYGYCVNIVMQHGHCAGVAVSMTRPPGPPQYS